MKWLLKLLRRRHLESDLAEELAYHREMRAADPDAPPFGNVTRIRESMREQWTFRWIETAFRDAAFALRGFRKSPGFAIAAIGSLALGIGVVIAIYTAADDLLFRPLPYREPDRLVMLWESNRTVAGSEHNSVSPGNLLDWKSRNRVFDGIAAFYQAPTILQDGDRAEQFHAEMVSANFFPLLGVQAFRGRLFTEAEDLASAQSDSLVLISYRLWQTWFAGDARIVGHRVMINSLPRTIIGVMPPNFYFRDRAVDLWAPLGLDPARPYRLVSGRYMLAVARLNRALTFARAQSEMNGLAAVIERENSAFNKNWTVTLEPLRDSLVRSVRTSLLLLLAAVGLLLAAACANVANLLLARYSARRSEMALRLALGAGRGRLTRQLLTESLMLAALGAAGGILLGHYALIGLVALAPEAITHSAYIAIDWRIVLFAVGLSAVTGSFIGLAPSLIVSKPDIALDLKRTSAWGGIRAWLIAGEIAASVILLTGASLFFRSVVKLQHVHSGLNPAHVLTFRFSTPAARYKVADRVPFFERLIERVERLPGVRSASAVSYLPFDGMAAGTDVKIGGRPPADPGKELGAVIRTVMPRYFETLGIPVRRGRDFAPADNLPNSPIRFIVNEAFVHKYLPGEDPLGHTISADMDDSNPFGAIVGVVGDVKEGSLDKEPEPTVYYVHGHLSYPSLVFVVRTDNDSRGIIAPIRRIVHDLDSALPIAEVRTMEAVLGETYARERFSTVLLGGFSASALLLAAIGIYGVLAYSVAKRTREIGIRVAVGADAGCIVRMVLAGASRFVLTGLGIGMVGAFAFSRFVSSLLFETGPHDPLTFALTPAILIAVALAAAYIPARRASRLDPLRALRVE